MYHIISFCKVALGTRNVQLMRIRYIFAFFADKINEVMKILLYTTHYTHIFHHFTGNFLFVFLYFCIFQRRRLYKSQLTEPYLWFPKDVRVLDVWDHHVVLTLSFKLLSFYILLQINAVFSLYLNICRLRTGPGKLFTGLLKKSKKSPGFFCQ